MRTREFSEKSELAILANLVKFKILPGLYEEVPAIYQYIDNLLAPSGFIAQSYPNNGVISQVWSKNPKLEGQAVLCAHVDVVPASDQMFTLKEDGDIAIGRGASDMKFAVACFVSALLALDSHPISNNLAMMLVSDEESGGFEGAQHLVKDIGYRPEVVILPDGGDNWKIVEEAKGAACIEVTAIGSSAHASKQWEGASAINKLVAALHAVSTAYPELREAAWQSTVNLGTIQGGTARNQVAVKASALVDIRSINREELDKIEQLLKTNGCITDRFVDKPNFYVDRNNRMIQQWQKTLREVVTLPGGETEVGEIIKEHSSADHHWFSDVGVPVVVSKPRGGLIHTENEWIQASDLPVFTEALIHFLASLNHKE